jgi:class 3 adenylate cyclase
VPACAFLGVTKSLDELGQQEIAFQPTLRTILFTDLEGSTEMKQLRRSKDQS